MGTFSIWHWLIVLIVIVAPIVGAWTGWKRHLAQKTYVIVYCVLNVVVFIGGLIGPANFDHPAVGLGAVIAIPAIYFSGTHVMVRRLNTVGWSKWLGCIPVISALVGIVLLFKRTPQPVAEELEGK